MNRAGWVSGNAIVVIISGSDIATASGVVLRRQGSQRAGPARRVDDGQYPPPPHPACSDGVDNDGDGKIDYPADPGCTGASDTDETNAAVPPPSGAVPTPATYGFPDCFRGAERGPALSRPGRC